MKFKAFQLQDLARAALTPGCVLAWDTGLGKTIAAFATPLLWVGYTQQPTTAADRLADPAFAKLPFTLRPKRPVLIVAPGDLHAGIVDEARERFRIRPIALRNQEHFLSLLQRDETGKPCLPPAFYLCSYTVLAQNGVADFPVLPMGNTTEAFLREWCIPNERVAAWHAGRGERFKATYGRLEATPEMSLPQLEECADRQLAQALSGHTPAWRQTSLRDEIKGAYNALLPYHDAIPGATLDQLPPDKRNWCRRLFINEWLADAAAGNGTSQAAGTWGKRGHWLTTRDSVLPSAAEQAEPAADSPPGPMIHCTHSPSLAELACNAFAVVAIDEGVRMKSDHTIVGRGVRLMNPAYRLVLTGTPIKNRLPDIFWLIAWANHMPTSATARWPFPSTDEAKAGFADEFLVTKTDLTAKRKGASKSRFKSVTAEVCQLHRLYKLMGPNLLRRRKDDIGQDIAQKKFNSIAVPMGTTQSKVYGFHLTAEYTVTTATGHTLPDIGGRMQALRQASAAPHSLNLQEKRHTDSEAGPHRSNNPHTPKFAACLQLIADSLKAGRQVVVFSAFHEPIDTLSRFLTEAGVKHGILDGRVAPKKRGLVSQAFKAGHTGGMSALPVALCATEATAEGHNWYRASVVIRFDLSWALDKNVQSINRVHRLNSPVDIDVWDLVVEGAIDHKLRDLTREKGDTSDLVLDGRLIGEAAVEVSAAEVLHHAAKAFQADTKTIDESVIEAQWPTLRSALRTAAQAWAKLGASSSEPQASAPPIQPIRPIRPTAPTPAPAPAPVIPRHQPIPPSRINWIPRIPPTRGTAPAPAPVPAPHVAPLKPATAGLGWVSRLKGLGGR